MLALKERLLAGHAESAPPACPRTRRADDPFHSSAVVVLRAEVRTETATPTVEELVLIFGGRFLDNSERLTEINGDRGPIEDKTTLHVMVRFKADGPGAPRPLLVLVPVVSAGRVCLAWPCPSSAFSSTSSRWIDGLSLL